jgi:uncharacterized protein YndB with AHSA1/START domain
MTTKNQLAEAVVIERTFNAPIARVWKALTDVEDMRRWYFDLKEFTPEVGFQFEFVVEHEGMKYHHLCKVTEVIPQKKIAYTWRYKGEQGDSLVTFELSADGNKTKLRLTHEGLETFPKTPAYARKNFEAGWTGIATELEQFLEGQDRQFVISRTFDAPRDLMWKIWTERDHLAKWFGPKGVTIVSAKNDLRVGGVFHYGMKTADGKMMWGKWIYREIVPPRRLVFIVSFSDKQGGVARHPFNAGWPLETLSTVTFAEQDRKTEVTVRWTPHNATESERKTFETNREGMKQGWGGTFDRLAEYVEERKS